MVSIRPKVKLGSVRLDSVRLKVLWTRLTSGVYMRGGVANSQCVAKLKLSVR